MMMAMRHEPLVRHLRLALELGATTLGLTLDEMAAIMGEEKGSAVSRSSAERAKRALSAVFPHLEAVAVPAGEPQRWRIPRQALHGLTGFGGADLAALATARQVLHRQGLGTQAAALDSLSMRLRHLAGTAVANDLADLLEAEGVAHRPGPRPLLDAAIVNPVRTAILARRRVRLHYVGRDSGRTSRQTVSPLGLLYGSRNYLLAYSHNPRAQAVRSFALTNISAVDALDEPAHVPEDWRGIRAHTAHWFGVWEEEPQEVVLRFNRHAAPDARAFLFHPSQAMRDLPHGRLEVRFTAGGLLEMAHHLWTWGDAVKVVKPKELASILEGEA